MSQRRVVVTGVGIVSSLGVGVKHVNNVLLDGRCGIQPISESNYYNENEFHKIPCKVAGFVPRGDGPGKLSTATVSQYIKDKVNCLASVYALVAAQEVFDDAGWRPVTDMEKTRTGVAVGTGMVDLEYIADMGISLRQKGYNKVSPWFIPRVLVNMCASQLSINYGLQGPNHAVSTACATGLHAIGDAYRFIKNNNADAMLCGATEASNTPLGMSGFARMRALVTNFNDDPERSSRPFDAQRNGFVMSEGCGLLLLENYDNAVTRGAHIYAEIIGYGVSGDAYHISAPLPGGAGAYRSMMSAMHEASLEPCDVGYINAHATSTRLGDEAEAKAIHKLLGDNAQTTWVSSTKGATGHLLGAAGSVEAIFTVLACNSGQLPQTINLENCDLDVNLRHVVGQNTEWDMTKGKRIALTNSFGFGGTNATLCISNFVK